MSTFAILLLHHLITMILADASDITYSDLQALNVTCPTKDSCVFMRNSNFTQRHCECDDKCSFFGDCCLDAVGRALQIPTRIQLSCMAFGQKPHVGAYVIGRCPAHYVESAEVARNCSYRTGYSDPVLAAPVTDTSTKVTYRNKYCAICNGASAALKTWLILVRCEVLESLDDEYVWRNLKYEPDIDRWGVQHEGIFQACKIIFDVPSYLKSSVRLCRAGVMFTCARDWTQVDVAEHCRSYMAVVYSEHDLYRNVHCALCNRLEAKDLYCSSGITPKRNPFSFALLLDVNTSDGNRVGQTTQCGSGQKFDPFFKRCRTLQCAVPGFVMQNGRCVKA